MFSETAAFAVPEKIVENQTTVMENWYRAAVDIPNEWDYLKINNLCTK
jgi:hypothetical protein